MISKRLRFANWVVDTLICAAIFCLILYIIYPSRPEEKLMPHIKLSYLVVTFIYYLSFEYFFKRTPGKFITNTRIIRVSTGSNFFTPVLIRTICRFIPIEAAFIFFSEDGLTLHDLLSKTQLSKNQTTNNEEN